MRVERPPLRSTLTLSATRRRLTASSENSIKRRRRRRLVGSNVALRRAAAIRSRGGPTPAPAPARLNKARNPSQANLAASSRKNQQEQKKPGATAWFCRFALFRPLCCCAATTKRAKCGRRANARASPQPRRAARAAAGATGTLSEPKPKQRGPTRRDRGGSDSRGARGFSARAGSQGRPSARIAPRPGKKNRAHRMGPASPSRS